MAISDLIDRYRAGQHEEVWAELQLLDVTGEPRVHEQAQLVCDEMARRCRRNVETIVHRLSEQGYRFHTNDDAKSPVIPHVPPGPMAQPIADWLLSNFASVPLTLLSWIRLVGDVWLVGTHPEWPDSAAADPLVIEAEGSRYADSSMINYFEEELDVQEHTLRDDATERFILPLSPDRLHKDNVSGGPPYGVVLPERRVDGVFVADTDLRFVDYLSRVFRRGGFPYGADTGMSASIRASLAADLLAV